MRKSLLVTFSFVLCAVLLGARAGPAQDGPRDREFLAAALLDDPKARGKMSAALEMKLLLLSGRMAATDELGGGAPEGTPVPAVAPPPADALVNDPAGDAGLSTTQSETTIRVNPVTGTICSAYNDSQHWAVGGTGFSGFSRSTDGGASFVDRGAIPPGGGGNSFGDPSLAWRAADGDFYYASLHSDGLGLWRSTDDCGTFAFYSMIHTGGGDDKELMAVDNAPSSSYYGRFYVAWVDFSAGDRIYLTHSDDGLTWSSPIALSAPGADVQGAWPTVAPNGDVYVGWVRWNPYSYGPIDIEIVRSVDGGGSFSPVNNPMTGQVNPRDPSATSACGRPALHANAGDGLRYLPSPQLEVGPDGCLHVVYSYDPDSYLIGDAVNVYYRRSCDNGNTWGTEVQLNDDGTLTDQWFPTVSVGATNTVVATWYDRRLDPGSNYLFDYYLRTSADGGITWTPSTRVTDVSSAVPSLKPNFDPTVANCYHGDYDQQVQDGAFAYVQWSDDRNIQNGHPDPDIWFEKVTLCEAGAGTLEGTVTDASSGAPIEGAEVTTHGVVVHTDSAGFYQLTLCADTYDVTASAFGYFSATQFSVDVTDGAVTVVDFALAATPLWALAGTVTDSTTGWPLYAEVDYGFGSVWTDPETGEYSVDLPEGAYGLGASAWAKGYLPAAVVVNIVTDTTQDFQLDFDSATCDAPGYEGGGFFDDFESGAPGWTATGLWHLADASLCGDPPPYSPPTAFYYGLDGSCNYNVGTNQGELTSPIISDIDASTTLSFNHWREVESYPWPYFDRTWVDIITPDGSATTVFSLSSEDPSLATWIHVGPILLAPFAGQPIRVRFGFATGDGVANNYTGWFIDDVRILAGACQAPSDGGLVVGNVYDANLGDGVVGAEVADDAGGSATTEATPEDPDRDDGFYTLYVPTGPHDLTASAGPSYGADTETVVVADLGTVEQDFQLQAGRLVPIPSLVEVEVIIPDPGTETVPVQLENDGQLDASFWLVEHYSPPPPTLLPGVPYERRSVADSDESQTAPFGAGRGEVGAGDPGTTIDPALWIDASPIPTGPRYRAAGTTCDCGSYYVFGGSTGGSYDVLDEAWRYEPETDTWTPLAPMPVALMNQSATCIDGYIYLVGGYVAGGVTNDFQIYDTETDTWTSSTWPRARATVTAAWDGKLYAFGGYPGLSNETWVYDPATALWSGPLAPLPTPSGFGGAVTAGDYIYVIGGGGLNDVQRYDPEHDAWDNSGPQLQDERMSALTVEYGGLIYVVSGGGAGGGVWNPWSTTEVYDPSLWPGGSWSYHDESVSTPAVGMAGACAGDRVWGAGGYTGFGSTDTNRSLDDGFTCYCGAGDVPWLWLEPTSGMVPANDEEVVSFHFDATGLVVGDYEAWVEVEDDTPYCVAPVPVIMHVSDNQPPICSAAIASPDELWSPNHEFVDVAIVDVTDPDGDPVSITITSVNQNEPTDTLGDGSTCPDGAGVGESRASLRAERSGILDGRVYHVSFRADDGRGGECEGIVEVCVPHDEGDGSECVDQGSFFDSTICEPTAFTWSKVGPRFGRSIRFTRSSTGQPVEWSWDFGDGSTASEPNPEHTYSEDGTYIVRLTVSDGQQSYSISHEVVVGASAAIPGLAGWAVALLASLLIGTAWWLFRRGKIEPMDY